jgi:molybdopterin converting factor small subunit
MAQNTGNNVDQIRDLIFGQQIREFEEKFARLEQALKSHETKAAQTLEKTLGALESRLERTIGALEEKLDQLSAASLKERTRLREMVESSDELLQASMTQIKNDLATKLKLLEENTADMGSTFRDEMRQMRDEIEAEVARKVDALSAGKLSRDTFAQVLVETAMRLQGQSPESVAGSDTDRKEKGPENAD